MKSFAVAATNNSFWFYQWNAKEKLQAFEIDVVEGHYPNDMNSNIHNCGVKCPAKTTTVTNPCYDVDDLSTDFYIWLVVDKRKHYSLSGGKGYWDGT